ncbi:MAG: hypothetical protein ACXAC7_10100 [Candidatus Hodarchaeales archaeon]|jgi:hypothetical protein
MPITRSKRTQLEAEGWTRKFTIEELRVNEYKELYESLELEVHIESVIPNELEEEKCQICYEAECNKYKIIYTRPKTGKKKERDLE